MVENVLDFFSPATFLTTGPLPEFLIDNLSKWLF